VKVLLGLTVLALGAPTPRGWRFLLEEGAEGTFAAEAQATYGFLFE
jgi:hypothetical protein